MTCSRAGKRSLGRLATSCALVMLAASCQLAESTYFDQGSSAAQSGSAPAGTNVYAGIANLEIHPGDQVVFVSIETSVPARGLAGPLRATNAAIGLATRADLTASDLAPYRDFGGPPFSSADGPIGILLEIATPASQLDIVTPVLTFTVNGGAPKRERILMALRICSNPKTSDPCPAPDPPAIPGR